jgi:hypothetical protein
MSLRAFHLLFIALSVVLAAFFAAWAASQYRVNHEASYVVTCVASMTGAVVLAFYGAAFQRKTRGM